MSYDIKKRLNSLRTRRSDGSSVNTLAGIAGLDSAAKLYPPIQESWEKLSKNMPFSQYAIGAMEPVSENYTKISINSANRVGNQLKSKLEAAGHSVTFRLQGSVALDIHIKGVSDVDLLTIDVSFLTYNKYGLLSGKGHYTPARPPLNSLSTLTALRKDAEIALKDAFPTAKVDTSGGKAINISGGSLQRVVDVVPAHWHDSEEYQLIQQESYRAITILNKKVPETINNKPFLHIKKIREQCDLVDGGLRKAIRLCKNVKADAEAEGKTITLPSFDIAATMYHADMNELKKGRIYFLVILAETQRFLDYLACNHEYAKTLLTPDGSRYIFDTREKLIGLNELSVEMDELLRSAAKEHDPLLSLLEKPPLGDCRSVIVNSLII